MSYYTISAYLLLSCQLTVASDLFRSVELVDLYQRHRAGFNVLVVLGFAFFFLSLICQSPTDAKPPDVTVLVALPRRCVAEVRPLRAL